MMTQDCYSLHKFVLSPFIGSCPTPDFSVLRAEDRRGLVDFLSVNGLVSFWKRLLHDTDTARKFSIEERARIQQEALGNGARYLMQKYVLDRMTGLFEEQSIRHALFKGGHIREILYREPSVRPSADLDVLIAPGDLEKTVHLFTGAGFEIEIKKRNVSGELTLFHKNVAIDLHWQIMRPGRLRFSLTDEFLASSRKYPTHYGFDSETTLFIMLVHPVFTKYSTTSLASLMRMIDLDRWLETQPIDWNRTLALLKKYHVRTPAWITARYFEILTGKSLPEPFVAGIKPGPVKQHYLDNWLQTNRAGRLMGRNSAAIQLGFTLAAHDSPTDVIRFLATLAGERVQAEGKKQQILQAVSPESRVRET